MDSNKRKEQSGTKGCSVRYERSVGDEEEGRECVKNLEIGLFIREDPFKLAPPLCGHCPNSNYIPPPALKRALRGTFFRRDFTILPFYHFFYLFFTIFSE